VGAMMALTLRKQKASATVTETEEIFVDEEDLVLQKVQD